MGILLRGKEDEKVKGRGTGYGKREWDTETGNGDGEWGGIHERVITKEEMTADMTGDG